VRALCRDVPRANVGADYDRELRAAQAGSQLSVGAHTRSSAGVDRYLRARMGRAGWAGVARPDLHARRAGAAMVGAALARKYDFEKLALLFARGKLDDFLKSQGEAALLGGWLAQLRPYHGIKVVGDHNEWPYFAERFGIQVVGFLEPKPGIPPTTAHLNKLVTDMKTNGVKVVLASAYYDPRYAQFVSENAGAKIASMANQAGARPGTDDYIAMVDYNVRQLVAALGSNT